MIEQIREELFRSLVDGKLTPGEHLIESDIARKLGVSRTPVRDAMRSLIELGLVEKRIHRGCFVATASPPEICLILEAREATEGMAARLMALRRSEDDVAALWDLHAQMAAVASDENYLHYRALHFQLHCAVLRGSGNEYIARYMGAEALLLKCLINYPPGFIAPVLHVHRDIPHASIVSAISGQDADAAEVGAREHILSTRRRLARWYENNRLTHGVHG